MEEGEVKDKGKKEVQKEKKMDESEDGEQEGKEENQIKNNNFSEGNKRIFLHVYLQNPGKKW